MLNKSELRNACYRAKKGVATSGHDALLAVVSPLLNETQCWDNFPKVWDIMLDRNGKVVIIKPETDYDYIHSTLLEAAMNAKANLSFDSFDDRQMNIISQVESLMLIGIMSWDNYNRAWGVGIDPSLKTISTKQYNIKSGQITVTPAMIEASKKDADGTALTEVVPKVLLAKSMSDAEVTSFKQRLSKKQKSLK